MSSRSLWAILALAVALLSFRLGGVALLDPDEGRYAAAAPEMVSSGDPIVPRFNGEPRLNKPPLIYWAQAASYLVLGESEWAARLPSLLSAVALAGLIAWWASRRIGAQASVLAVASLATIPLFFACARLAITDMMLALWIGATLLIWHEAVTAKEPGARRRLSMAASLACGLAALTKGPVGALLPAAVIIATATVARRSRLVTARGAAMALAGSLLVAGPWLAGLSGRIGWEGTLDLIGREGIERAVRGLDHPRPFHYFLVSFWPTFFPWSLAAPLAFVAAWRSRREADLVGLFLACWLACVILFFTMMADKNDAYLLPAAPALALMVARHVPRRIVLWTAGAMAILLVAALLSATGPLSRARSTKDLVLAGRLDPAGGRGDFTLLSYRLYKPSLVYYAGRRAVWVTSGEELRGLLAGTPEGEAVAIVMTRPRLDRMRPGRLDGFVVVAERGGCVVLFRESRPAIRSAAAPPPCSCCA
ncbi:MAG TPA: glycosyltransferase family 39 protein [Candidatus Polarisedimenticolia bacterium]|jgi:4-amino-4-deoxy-L-arabinose transferase-like glycosyltransferase